VCSPQVFTHELGHVLGFVKHAEGYDALMRLESHDGAWDVSETEVASLRNAVL
jgi:hypothetical protein